MKRRVAAVLAMAAVLGSPACRQQSKDEKPSKQEVKELLERYEKLKEKEKEVRQPKTKKPATAAATIPSGSGVAARSGPRTDSVAAPGQRPGRAAAVSKDGPWIVDEVVDIAPAGPITATADGIYMYDKKDRLFVARVARLPARPRPTKTPVSRLKGAGRFPLGRGPGIFKGNAYWTSGNRLVRRATPKSGKTGPLEVLAADARSGTRVATPLPMRDQKVASVPSTAAYIVQKKKDGPLTAKLWVEGGETRGLTPEGSSTHSVALVHTRTGLIAVSLQARMAISPIHARTIQFAKKVPLLGEDVVVWVGGGAQSTLTELSLLPGRKKQLWGFYPHEKSITEFGLARLDITAEPDMDTPIHWTHYPNGIDPAPVSGAYLCGEPTVAYARPSGPDPDASQQLVLESVSGEKTQSIATGEAFFDISMATMDRGAVIAYVADWVTWAVSVRCKK